MSLSKNVSFILLLFISFINAQYINVSTSFTANDLVDKLIGTNNNCLLISNVSISGWDFGAGDTSYGFFTKGSSNFEIDEGIILSTGKAKKAEGPKNDTQSEYNFYWGKDQDLIDILNKYHLDTTNIRNATSLEFDFIANTDKISFEYMFLSEEYRPRNCDYSDAFAFLIKKADNS